LFFDLVFVFTFTQLTRLLVHDPDLLHLLRVTVLLAIIFWMYGGYAWLTNAVAADTTARRLVLLGGMAGFLLVALTVPRSFDGGGLAFGLAYAVVVAVHIGLFTRTQRVRSARDLVRVGLLNVTGTVLIVIGGALGGLPQLVLWILVPLVWWVVSPYRRLSGGFDIGAAHFVERHGLVLIIAIGESLVELALGLSDLELGFSVAAVAVLGLALSACLWWTYFGGDDTSAEQALTAAPREFRPRLALQAFGHAYLGLLLGVIAIAAGLEAGAHDPFHALDLGHAVAIGGGAALYLLSDAWFRQRLRIGRPWPRAVAALPALGTMAVAVWSAAAQVAILLLVFLILFALESRWNQARVGAAAP
jgi:low temperature requirement protein LtrA